MGIVKNADLYEIEVADILVTRGDEEFWIEVKMDPTNSQLGSPRPFYRDGSWQATKNGPMERAIIARLTLMDGDFMEELREFSGRATFDLESARSKKKSYPNVMPYKTMVEFIADRGNTYIFNELGVDLTDVVTGHYIEGKAVPTHYMSMGDHFYRLSDENPLGVPDDVPLLHAIGKFGATVSCRQSKPWYEIMPRLKATEFLPSKYSINPGTDKINPFTSG
jgi:hypothetical protein